MGNQLIPPPELAPPSVGHLPLSKRIELWADLVDTAEAFLIGGLQRKVGPAGDWRQAYREWYARHMNDHEKTQIQLLKNLSGRGTTRGE